MAKLDLEWLAIFAEIYRTQSVSRAAQRLGVAQATASIMLSKLRNHFDDPLFVRTSRGMEPTPKAASIYPEIEEALGRIAKARGTRSVFSPADSARGFRVCMTDISQIVLLPRLINHFRHNAPHVHVDAERISTETPRHLESGEMDLAVGFIPGVAAGFYEQTLFEQDYVCLAAADHPRIRGKLTRRAFVAEGHIVVSSSGTGHAIVDKMLTRSGVERRVLLRLSSFLGVGRIVAQTELLVIVPRMLGETLASQERLQVLASPVALPSFKVKQHWHERFHRDAGGVWLRATLAQLFASRSRTAAAV